MGLEAIVVASIVGAAATGTASAIGAASQKGSSKRAAEAEMSALDKQLAFEKEKEAERKAEWERAQTEAKAQWEASQALEETRYNTDVEMRRAEFELAKQKYLNRQAQMAPYRTAGLGALSQLATLAGVASPTAAAAPLLQTMPENWKPGDPVTANTPSSAQTTEAPTSLLENEQVLPTTLPPEPTVVEPTAKTQPLPINEAAYQTLAQPRTEASGPMTPEQRAALALRLKAAERPSLSALARSRRMAV